MQREFELPDSLEPEVEKTLDALNRRYPAFGAYERFVRERLAELAYRSHGWGVRWARSDLMTTSDVAAHLRRSPRQVRYMARQHELGWQTDRDWVFTHDDMERMREIINTPRRGRRTDLPEPTGSDEAEG